MPPETVHRFYSNGRLATECGSSGNRSYFRHAGSLFGQHTSGDPNTPCLMATDASGSVIRELDASVSQHACYAPYGQRSPERPAERPMAFNGEPLDWATGGYLLGNGYRLYSPTLRRFASPDDMSPFGAGGINTYAYCAGDPVNRVDPSGHFSLSAALSLFGALGLVASAATFFAAALVKDEALQRRLFNAAVAVGVVATIAMGAAVLRYKYSQPAGRIVHSRRVGTTLAPASAPAHDTGNGRFIVDPHNSERVIWSSGTRNTGALSPPPGDPVARAVPSSSGSSAISSNPPPAYEPPPNYPEALRMLKSRPTLLPPTTQRTNSSEAIHVLRASVGAQPRNVSSLTGSPVSSSFTARGRIRRTL